MPSKRESEPLVILVGAGTICRTAHIQYLEELGVRILHVVDPDPIARNYVISRIPGVSASQTLSELPKEANCAIVSTPPAFHYRQARLLLQEELNVLCEKPLGCTAEEARDLVKLAEKNRVVIQAGYYRRFHPVAKAVHTILRSRDLGKIIGCEVYGGHPVRSNELPTWAFDKRLSGGGVLMDFGVHVLDRLLSWFDELILESYFDDNAGGVEANAVIDLTGTVCGSKVPIKLTLSRTNKLGYYTVLKFDKCDVRIEHNVGHSIQICGSCSVLGTNVRLSADLQVDQERSFLEYFVSQWHEFVARMRGGSERVSSLDDAVRTTAMVGSCYGNKKELGLPWEDWGG
jgi:predicted dehydrogenase